MPVRVRSLKALAFLDSGGLTCNLLGSHEAARLQVRLTEHTRNVQGVGKETGRLTEAFPVETPFGFLRIRALVLSSPPGLPLLLGLRTAFKNKEPLWRLRSQMIAAC